MDPDLDLLTRYHHEGDAGAFQALVTAHAGMVYAAARRVTQNAALAEEVAQDTFLALACRGQLVRESVAAWLHHVARQKACNALRGERRRQRAEQSVPPEESEASWAEIEPLLDEAIDGLPERLRGLVIGHFLEQRTQQEMARRLGWSQATVSRQIGTALQALRDGLKRKGVMCGLGLAGLLNARTVHAAPPSLTASLGKMAVASAGNTAAASSLIAMTTTTKLCLATAALAGTWLFVPHHAPAPAPAPPATLRPLAFSPKPAPPSPVSQPQEHTRADAAEEKELILAEFKRMGGTIREEFVDADINSILQNQFGGDRMGLERRLAEEGQTYEQFKTQRRETIIVQVMKARTTQGIADTGEKQQAVDNWLAELRMKSLGASSRPTASSASEE